MQKFNANEIEQMRIRMRWMVDAICDQPGMLADALTEGWGWPSLRMTFSKNGGDTSDDGYTLIVGVASPVEDSDAVRLDVSSADGPVVKGFGG